MSKVVMPITVAAVFALAADFVDNMCGFIIPPIHRVNAMRFERGGMLEKDTSNELKRFAVFFE